MYVNRVHTHENLLIDYTAMLHIIVLATKYIEQVQNRIRIVQIVFRMCVPLLHSTKYEWQRQRPMTTKI